MPDTTRTLPVQGMHCKGCANLVRSILEDDVAGVKSADVNLENENVTIVHDESTNLLDARQALQENGYTLVLPDNE